MNKKKPVHKHGTMVIPAEGNPEFDWTFSMTDRERIRENSMKYKELSVVDAFGKAYKKRLKKVSEVANSVPDDVRIGSVLKVDILSVSKGHTVFDAGNLKEPISSTVDLWKFPVFKKFLPSEPIDVVVVDKRMGTLYVDPILPVMRKWEDSLSEDRIKNQYSMTTDESVEVSDLRWVPGGFIGKVDVPQITEFTGQKFQVPAFIPGSQIVLNIERDFDKWVGKTVRAFVTNQPTSDPKSGKKSVVCSVKRYLENKGNIFKINLFKSWTENGDLWKANEKVTYDGVVTGVIHSSKKCGVFVELPSCNITGLVAAAPEALSEFHPGDQVKVKITSFDELRKYDPFTEQFKHIIPYRIVDDVIVECHLKPVLEFA